MLVFTVQETRINGMSFWIMALICVILSGASRCALQPLLNAVDHLLPPPHLISPLSAPPIFRLPLPHSLPDSLFLPLPPSVYTSSFRSSSLEHPRCWCCYKYPLVALTAEQRKARGRSRGPERRTGQNGGMGSDAGGWEDELKESGSMCLDGPFRTSYFIVNLVWIC